MTEISKPSREVKSYKQQTYWLNEKNYSLVVGKLRQGSYQFPHGTKVFDRYGNTILEEYSNFERKYKLGYVYNEFNNLKETYISDELDRVFHYDNSQNLISVKNAKLSSGRDFFHKYDNCNRNIETLIKKKEVSIEKWTNEYNDIDGEYTSEVFKKDNGKWLLESTTISNSCNNVIKHQTRKGYKGSNEYQYDENCNVLKVISRNAKNEIVYPLSFQSL